MPTSPKVYANIDEALSKTLLKGWSARASGLATEAVMLYEAGKYPELKALVYGIDLASLVTGKKQAIKALLLSAFMFGVGRMGSPRQSLFVKGKKKVEVIDNAVHQVELMLGQANARIHSQLMVGFDKEDSRRKEEAQKVKKADLVRDFVSFIAKDLSNAGMNSVQIAASLQTSRLAQYGFCVEAELRGINIYKVNEVLDMRTCSVCGIMHGKVFDVQETHSRLETLLRIDDPAVLKAVAPWPRQTKDFVATLKRMSRDDMVKSGWGSPPYHPRCRGYIDVATETDAKVKATPIDTFLTDIKPKPKLEVPSITPELAALVKAEFGGMTTDKVVSEWYAIFKESPEKVKARMANALDMPVDAVKLDLRLTTQTVDFEVAGKVDGLEVKRSFRQDKGKLVVEHELFKLTEGLQSLGTAKRGLARLMEWYRDIQAAEVRTFVNVDVGGYAWSKYGFSTTIPHWKNIRSRMIKTFKEHEASLTKESVDIIMRIGRSDDPRGLWALADISDTVLVNGTPMSFGKAAMLGTMWEGRLALADADAMTRFHKYIGGSK